MPTSASKGSGDKVISAAEDAVRASLEAAAKIARESLDASTEAARKVQRSLKDALDALTEEQRGSGSARRSR
jgi:hypothetical protein